MAIGTRLDLARAVAVAALAGSLALAACSDPAPDGGGQTSGSDRSSTGEPVSAAATNVPARDSSELRLRGPRLAVPRSVDDSEHPHPQYPRMLNRDGADARGRTRLRRDFPHTVTLPVRYGLLHAHTWYSDGSGTPAEAFARAASLGLDFLAVTEHNHDKAEQGASGERRDKVLIATNPDLMNAGSDVTFVRQFKTNGTEQTETVTSPSLVSAATQATTANFVAIVGQEFSSISSGNHLNVLGWNELLTVGNGDFGGLYSGFGDATPVLQMNHPDVQLDLFYRGSNSATQGNMFNDYGFDDFGEDFATLVAEADKFIVLLEVLTGPAFAESANDSFHYDHHENDYYYYLIQGFHLSPSVGHDNHFRTWGDATPARMGVFASSLTTEGLLNAMRANRTFASEDRDLRIDFQINGAGMGEVLTLDTGTALNPRLVIADSSDANSEYTVELIYGDVQAQQRANLVKWVPSDGLTESFTFTGEGQLDFDAYEASGLPEFFYVRVTQGDGDRAWSAPIWINHPRSYPAGGDPDS
ncbi:MAG: hypothetical protein OEW68_15855 [Gammaproteobacteria bacterium]|nr:hypothetical protein [Gammaproteobacteria bacterium]MDH4316299.1 hypothetical protein [Gammaproteobacteria bacterium]MDH5215652.1 hypothetical protein [Gammaproteobacteria bacterium]